MRADAIELDDCTKVLNVMQQIDVHASRHVMHRSQCTDGVGSTGNSSCGEVIFRNEDSAGVRRQIAAPDKSMRTTAWLICHTRPMVFSPSLIRQIALLVLLAFTGARLADAHLHVCLDGNEPPVSVHAMDGSVHNDAHHQEADHPQDTDVAWLDAALLKAGLDADVFAVAAVWTLVLQIIADTPPRPEPLFTPLLRLPAQFKPPLRGPPL